MDTIDQSVAMEGKFKGRIISFILGIGALIAMNNMWTMGDYYYKIFPRYHPMQAFTFMYQPFSLVTTLILAHYESRINARIRSLCGYSSFLILSFVVIVLDLATLSKGGSIGPFIGFCIIFGCFGVTHAFVQGGVCGELSSMCPEFVQSFISGINASGAVACGLRVLTKFNFEKHENGLRKGALLSLGISTVFQLLSIILYVFYFSKLSIVKYYRSKTNLEGATPISNDIVETNQRVANQQELLSHKELFLQNIDYAFDIFMVYVITLSIMPGFLYEDTGTHELGTWYPLVLMTMYNIMDFISSYIPLIQCLKLESRKGLMVATLSRFLLIPAFYFTAKYGDQGWMIFLVSYLGLSNGYLTVCVFTSAPKGYKGREQNALGNMITFCLLGGVFAGSGCAWLWLIGKPTSMLK